MTGLSRCAGSASNGTVRADPCVRRVSGDEAELAAALAGARPHPRAAEIPPALKPWLLPVSWDRTRLWSLDRDPVSLPVAELRWLYALPLWRDPAGRWFELAPHDFLLSPDRHPEHRGRVEAADPDFPVHAIRRHGRWFLLDGVHRLVRADLRGEPTVTAVVVRPEDLAVFVDYDGPDDRPP